MLTKSRTQRIHNPYLEGNFAPVLNEVTTDNLKVKGEIPKDLNGRLVRIGPNPVTKPDPAKYHWFIGNGMVHGIDIQDGQALAYRNRFVVDPEVAAALGKPPIGGPSRWINGGVNTNVIDIDGKIYAVVEAGGLPIQLDADLNSVQRSNFDGTLKAGFAAHHRRAPESGELHTIIYEAGQKNISYVVVDKLGNARTATTVKLSHAAMIHDTAITSSFVVILDLPVSFNISMAVSGKKFPFKWNPKVIPRIGLLPREHVGGEIEWFDVPSCFVFHILNAYETESEVIIDVVRHPKMFDKHLNGPREGKTSLVRWTIDRDRKRLVQTTLSEREIEFPRINEAFTGLPYRFGYTCHAEDILKFGSVYKHDVETKTTIEHNFGEHMMSGEPVFVAKANVATASHNAQAEDDGWILCCVFSANSQTSEIHILDAQRFSEEPEAIIELPVRVPFGFHGNWFANASSR